MFLEPWLGPNTLTLLTYNTILGKEQEINVFYLFVLTNTVDLQLLKISFIFIFIWSGGGFCKKNRTILKQIKLEKNVGAYSILDAE